MYYHPDMFEWANRDRVFATCHAFAAVWLDGVSRQQLARAQAVCNACAKRMGKLRIVTGASDTAKLAAGLLSCAAPDPLELVALATQLGTIAMDTNRKLGELIASHGDEMTRSVLESAVIVDTPQTKVRNGGRPGGRRHDGA